MAGFRDRNVPCAICRAAAEPGGCLISSPITIQGCQIGRIGRPDEGGPDVVGQHVLKVPVPIHHLLLACVAFRRASVDQDR